MSDVVSKRIPIVPATVLLLFGVLLVYLLLVKSFAGSFAEDNPETALSLNPNEPTALLYFAFKKFSEAKIKKDDIPAKTEGDSTGPQRQNVPISNDRIETWARGAMQALKSTPKDVELKNVKTSEEKIKLLEKEADEARHAAQSVLLLNPLDSSALRLLGQIAYAEDKEEETQSYMRAAYRRSIRESIAVFWLLKRSLEKQDFLRSSELFDIALRTGSASQTRALPAFIKFSEAPEGKEEVKKLLASNPPWRAQFFSSLQQNLSDVRTPLDFLLSLQNTPHPANNKETSSYLNFLATKNFHELSYYSWLQFLPEEQLEKVGYLYNGSFEMPPSGSPFDWSIRSGNGTITEIAPLPDDTTQKGLFIEFIRGRVEFQPVTQSVLLAPGTYQLTGKYKGQLIGKRGLVWRVSCAVGSKLLAETEMFQGIAKTWKEFSLSFEVPETECRAQTVRLELDARSSSEKLVSGSLWYDDVEIVPTNPKISTSPKLSPLTTGTTDTSETNNPEKSSDTTPSKESSQAADQTSPPALTSNPDASSRVSERPVTPADTDKSPSQSETSTTDMMSSEDRSSERDTARAPQDTPPFDFPTKDSLSTPSKVSSTSRQSSTATATKPAKESSSFSSADKTKTSQTSPLIETPSKEIPTHRSKTSATSKPAASGAKKTTTQNPSGSTAPSAEQKSSSTPKIKTAKPTPPPKIKTWEPLDDTSTQSSAPNKSSPEETSSLPKEDPVPSETSPPPVETKADPNDLF